MDKYHVTVFYQIRFKIFIWVYNIRHNTQGEDKQHTHTHIGKRKVSKKGNSVDIIPNEKRQFFSNGLLFCLL